MMVSIRIYPTDNARKWQIDVVEGRDADGKKRRVREHFTGDQFGAEERRREFQKLHRDGTDLYLYLKAKKAAAKEPREAPAVDREDGVAAVPDFLGGGGEARGLGSVGKPGARS